MKIKTPLGEIETDPEAQHIRQKIEKLERICEHLARAVFTLECRDDMRREDRRALYDFDWPKED